MQGSLSCSIPSVLISRQGGSGVSAACAGADERGGEEGEDDRAKSALVMVHDVGEEGLGACWERGVGGSRARGSLCSKASSRPRRPRPRRTPEGHEGRVDTFRVTSIGGHFSRFCATRRRESGRFEGARVRAEGDRHEPDLGAPNMPNAMPSPIFNGPHGSPLCFAILAGFFDSMMYSTCLLRVMVAGWRVWL